MDASNQRPNLLSKGTVGNGNTGGQRILASLEHGGAMLAPNRLTRLQLNGWTLALLALLLILSVLAWMTHRDGAPPLRHALPLSARAPTNDGASTPPLADLVNRTAPAAIINEPSSTLPVARGNERNYERSSERNNEPVVDIVRPDKLVGRPANKAAMPARRADYIVAKAANAADNTGNAAHSPTAASAASTSKAGASKPTPAPSGAGRNLADSAGARDNSRPPAQLKKAATLSFQPSTALAADTDVTLLAALVAHASQPTMVVAENSRDVVERKDGDATAGLLQRCKQLGQIEGMLCRSRICSGRWDNDPACRAPSH
ncbi:hypothetical protein [Rugamonas rubra]|uniref:Uncharacterized protein n=1 Tax=Rugamonas rubra TaxID=758825 RepID=A0A1I4QRG1_9BURK|nr:hypothetical protein [Rugamonas rubra]SFM42621.1 hypothetical protein SAMN02982985_04015 [Rugamonas rubra]